MRTKIFILLLGFSVHCFSQKYNDNDKVIGGIYFGMSKDTVDKKIEEFNIASQKPDKVIPSINNYYIGNHQYLWITGDFFNDSLYMIRIDGYLVNWKYFDSEIPSSLQAIVDIIKSKYGNPTKVYTLQPRYKYKDGYSYPLRQWIIKQKLIDVRLDVSDSYYKIITIIKRTDIEKKKQLIEKKENEAITKSAKDVF